MVENNVKPNTTSQGCGSIQDLTGKIELIDDNIILNEDFKKNVAIPYFKDIYKDLSAQSDAKAKGINKVSILTVSLLVYNMEPISPSFVLCSGAPSQHSTSQRVIIRNLSE